MTADLIQQGRNHHAGAALGPVSDDQTVEHITDRLQLQRDAAVGLWVVMHHQHRAGGGHQLRIPGQDPIPMDLDHVLQRPQPQIALSLFQARQRLEQCVPALRGHDHRGREQAGLTRRERAIIAEGLVSPGVES
ncbi:hypothetical protein GCM10023321_50340 [Pseudonocardia eucalypti]|uniref:HTH luxR-type domain-containing protein n=1 Tax=Pseudonocardia eucalypti TaxID=648755 RepID=A0ABP9QKE7_9PSEU